MVEKGGTSGKEQRGVRGTSGKEQEGLEELEERGTSGKEQVGLEERGTSRKEQRRVHQVGTKDKRGRHSGFQLKRSEETTAGASTERINHVEPECFEQGQEFNFSDLLNQSGRAEKQQEPCTGQVEKVDENFSVVEEKALFEKVDLSTLPGAAEETVNPVMFFCEQAAITNNLLTSIASSLASVVNHLTGISEIGQSASAKAENSQSDSSQSTIPESSQDCESNFNYGNVSDKCYLSFEQLLEIKKKSTSPKKLLCEACPHFI